MRSMKLLLAALLVLLPLFAEALTKQECIHAGYGCQWSHSNGGRVNGWLFEKAKEGRHATAMAQVHRISPPQSVSLDRGDATVEHHKVSKAEAITQAKAKEVMPLEAKAHSSSDSRPRSAFPPAGAAQTQSGGTMPIMLFS